MSHYGLYKKLTIQFKVVENREALQALGLPQSKYISAHREFGSSVKYYKNGFSLMKTAEFNFNYGKDIAVPPTSDYVLLASLNKNVAPDHRCIIKTRNKVALILPVEIIVVKDGSRVHTNIGLSLNPETLEYGSLSVDMHKGTAEMMVKTSEFREYREKAEDIIPILENELEPLFTTMGEIVRRSSVNIWANEECRNAMLGFINRCLARADVYSPNASDFRILLGRSLLEGFSEVESDEVAWDSDEERLQALHEAGGDVEKAKSARKIQLRLKWLLDDLTPDQRLAELTRDEMRNHTDMAKPGIFTGMTDPELTDWFAADPLEAQEIEDKVYQRWEKIHEAE